MNVGSICPAFALLLPVMSVEGAGVGGKLGRGMMVRWPTGALIGEAEKVAFECEMLLKDQGRRTE